MKKLFLALALVSTTIQAQQQKPTLEQQDFQDALSVIQREAEGERNRARQAELALAKLQRELADAQKKVAACEPKKDEKK